MLLQGRWTAWIRPMPPAAAEVIAAANSSVRVVDVGRKRGLRMLIPVVEVGSRPPTEERRFRGVFPQRVRSLFC